MERKHSVPSEYNNNGNQKPISENPYLQNYDNTSSHNYTSSVSQIQNNGGNSRQNPFAEQIFEILKKDNNSNNNSDFSQNLSNGGNSKPPSFSTDNEPNKNTEQFNYLKEGVSAVPPNNNVDENFQINQEINNNNENNQINTENNNINNINKRPNFGITKDKRPNQTIANRTTTFTTKAENGNIQKIEKVEEKEKQKDVNNNKIEGTFHNSRNFRDIYLRNFFDNLLGFIDYLIEDCYQNNIISPIPLKLIKKEYIISRKAEEQYNMLDKKAIDVLKIDINHYKVIKDGKEKDVELYNQKLLWSYKGENAQKEKLLQITSVLNKKIGYLMEVYLGKVIPEEDYYRHFVRFKEYLSNLKRDNDYKEKLKNVAEVEFIERLNIVLFNDSHKRGRKAQIKNNV